MKGIGNTVWNGGDVNIYQSSNRRTSLVPAPAEIPAPEVYSKVVAVKTFVVYLRGQHMARRPSAQGSREYLCAVRPGLVRLRVDPFLVVIWGRGRLGCAFGLDNQLWEK